MTTTATTAPPGPKNPTLALFAVSVLGLFLELVLIRWLATEFRVLAYLQNVILVTCFLGLGLGAYTCRGRIDLGDVLKPLAFIAVLLVVPQTQDALALISGFLSLSQDFPIWNAPMLPGAGGAAMFGVGVLLLFFLLALVWDIFVPIGRIQSCHAARSSTVSENLKRSPARAVILSSPWSSAETGPGTGVVPR